MNLPPERPRVYLETTIASYLTARPSRDLVTAAHQQVTRDWWENRRADFDLFISEVVLRKAREGDPEAASRRLELLKEADLAALDLSDEAVRLADSFPTEGAGGCPAHRRGGGERNALPVNMELHPHRERGVAA